MTFFRIVVGLLICACSAWSSAESISYSYPTFPEEVKQINHPEFSIDGSRLLFVYQTVESEAHILASSALDGSGLKALLRDESGDVVGPHMGVKLFAMRDGKRIFLGRHIVECSPSVLDCRDARAVPIVYPSRLTSDPRVFRGEYSEIVIAPDDTTIAWSTPHMTSLIVPMIGRLERKEDGYHVMDATILVPPTLFNVSSKGLVTRNEQALGEVKQFIEGGKALSIAASAQEGNGDAVRLDLTTGEVTRLTLLPGYDETAKFSPDEDWMALMSTRDSESSTELFGLVPRPVFNPALLQLSYHYSVWGVRKGRQGNVGPLLLSLQDEMEGGTKAINLSSKEPEWAYYSPIAWHPDGTMLMWPENVKTNIVDYSGSRERLRIAHLNDRKPVAMPETVDIDIPKWGLPLKEIARLGSFVVNGRLAGSAEGHVDISMSEGANFVSGEISLKYVDFSDDGKNRLNGVEFMQYNLRGESTYRADLTLSGEDSGRMDVNMQFGSITAPIPVPITGTGYAELNGRRLDVEDLP